MDAGAHNPTEGSTRTYTAAEAVTEVRRQLAQLAAESERHIYAKVGASERHGVVMSWFGWRETHREGADDPAQDASPIEFADDFASDFLEEVLEMLAEGTFHGHGMHLEPRGAISKVAVHGDDEAGVDIVVDWDVEDPCEPGEDCGPYTHPHGYDAVFSFDPLEEDGDLLA